MDLLAAAVLVVLLGGLLIIPLGLPGLWVMLLALAVPAWRGDLSAWLYVGLLALGGLAELAEFLAVRRASARWGGSRRAFWGAILGGLAGAAVGAPLPLAGPLVGIFLGSFLGAFLFSWLETRSVGVSARVGWGAVVGRALAAGAKVVAGLVILLAGGAALFIP